jgi:CRP-like cAMP-binding protein
MLSTCFHKLTLHLGTFLFVEGDQAMDTYLVRKGEVQILKISQEFERQVKTLDLVQRVELLKSR